MIYFNQCIIVTKNPKAVTQIQASISDVIKIDTVWNSRDEFEIKQMFATPSYGHLGFTQSLHLAVELYTNTKPREWNELEKNLKINDLQKGEKIKVTRNNDTKMNSRLKWNEN